MDEVALQQVFLRVSLFSSASHPTNATFSSVTAPRDVRWPCPSSTVSCPILSQGPRSEGSLVLLICCMQEMPEINPQMGSRVYLSVRCLISELLNGFPVEFGTALYIKRHFTKCSYGRCSYL